MSFILHDRSTQYARDIAFDSLPDQLLCHEYSQHRDIMKILNQRRWFVQLQKQVVDLTINESHMCLELKTSSRIHTQSLGNQM